MMTPSDVHHASDTSGRELAARITRWSHRLVLGYLVAGLAWIFLGDWLIRDFRGSPRLAAAVELGKGIAFVVLSSALIAWVCLRMRRAAINAFDVAVESARAYQMLFENSPTGALIVDAGSRRVLAINGAALETFGWNRAEIVGAALSTTGMFADPADLQAWESDVAASGMPVHSSVRTCRHRLGRSLRLVLRCHAMTYRGSPAQLVVTEDRSNELLALAEAEDARALTESAERIAGVGSWRRHERSESGTWSANTWALFGRPPLPGNAAPPVADLLSWVHPDDRERLSEAIERLYAQGESIDLNYRILRPDGSIRVLHGLGVRRARSGFYEGTVQDVTDQVEYEHRLAEREAMFRSLVGVLPVGVLMLVDERVVFANDAAARQFGYDKPAEMERVSISEIFTAREIAGVRERIAGLGEEPQFRIRQMRCQDGSTFQAEVAKARIVFGGRPAVQLVVRDLSEQMHLWAELSEKHARLRQLSRRLLRVQEDERKMLARELHDDIGQTLTAITLRAGLAAASDDERERRDHLDELTRQSRQAIDRLRDLSSLLRPPQLDRLGIAAALRDAAGRIFGPDTTMLEMLIEEPATRPPRDVELACYRIAQECLTNVRRHASARRVRLRLAPRPDALHLDIVDDGRGFDSAAEPDATTGAGLGLVGMRERAEALGGSITIESRPGAGTRVHLRLPYDGRSAESAA